MNNLRMPYRARQRGAAAVEFALVSGIFFLLLIGVMELGRVLFYMNSAAEATRLGARVAVVCNLNADGIKRRMINMLPVLESTHIQVAYNPTGCNDTSCQSVTVSIQPASQSDVDGLIVNTLIPFIPFDIVMPPFTTTLTRESLSTVIDGQTNRLCN